MPTGHGPWTIERRPTRVGSDERARLGDGVAMRSRRVWLAASSASAWPAASAGSSLSRRRAASSASPTRPAALSRGARANAIVSRSTADGAIRARSSSAATPGRGAVRSSSSPSRAMARFSPTIGATSATVPMVARSARASAAAGPPGRSASSSCAILKATPLPARRRRDTSESGRCGLTTASAGGRTGGTRWWSVTRTSIPRRCASAISGPLLVPQSTVTMTVAPRASRRVERRPPTGRGPPRGGSGTYGSTATPNRRRAMHEDGEAIEPVRIEVAEDEDAFALVAGRASVGRGSRGVRQPARIMQTGVRDRRTSRPRPPPRRRRGRRGAPASAGSGPGRAPASRARGRAASSRW